MEVRIYLNLESYAVNKSVYTAKVATPSVFEFQKCLDVFKSIYGSSAVVIFMCYNN